VNTYIFLAKLTDIGAAGIHDTPALIEQVKLEWETLAGEGGSVITFYTTTGEYDHVIIAQAANDDVAAAFAMLMASLGKIRTVTLRAYDETQVAELLVVAHAHR
jgi:uncharacterized protein with GYD domain